MIAQQVSQLRQASQARYKLYALLEVLFVYALIQTLILFLGSTSVAKWERQNLGWSYIIPLICFVLIPALIIWLTHRNWTEHGVSLANWRTNLDIGIKALVIRIIPDAIGRGGGALLGLNAQTRDLAEHLQRVLIEFSQYYNASRPHQGIDQHVPIPDNISKNTGFVQRRKVLGGIINDYFRSSDRVLLSTL